MRENCIWLSGALCFTFVQFFTLHIYDCVYYMDVIVNIFKYMCIFIQGRSHVFCFGGDE